MSSNPLTPQEEDRFRATVQSYGLDYDSWRRTHLPAVLRDGQVIANVTAREITHEGREDLTVASRSYAIQEWPDGSRALAVAPGRVEDITNLGDTRLTSEQRVGLAGGQPIIVTGNATGRPLDLLDTTDGYSDQIDPSREIYVAKYRPSNGKVQVEPLTERTMPRSIRLPGDAGVVELEQRQVRELTGFVNNSTEVEKDGRLYKVRIQSGLEVRDLTRPIDQMLARSPRPLQFDRVGNADVGVVDLDPARSRRLRMGGRIDVELGGKWHTVVVDPIRENLVLRSKAASMEPVLRSVRGHLHSDLPVKATDEFGREERLAPKEIDDLLASTRVTRVKEGKAYQLDVAHHGYGLEWRPNVGPPVNALAQSLNHVQAAVQKPTARGPRLGM